MALSATELLYAVGEWYEKFSQTSDAEVVDLLRRATAGMPLAHVAANPGADPPVRDEEVQVEAGVVRLAGHLTLPDVTKGLVIFAHGSASTRHIPAIVMWPQS